MNCENETKLQEIITITLTAGEQSENHIGMEKQGNGLAREGFTIDELKKIKNKFEILGCQCVFKILNDEIQNYDEDEVETAGILIIRKGIDKILEQSEMVIKINNRTVTPNSMHMFNENLSLDWDTKYFDVRRNKVLNKHARHNLCYANESKVPDYINKQGRIIAYKDVPITQKILQEFEKYFEEKGKNLQLEGNLYYNIKKCGIGYHGDGERKIVIGMRLGASIPLHFQWYFKSTPIGQTIKFVINGGDIYIMSEKATGYDWKRKNIKTLRHAAGCAKYLVVKK